MEQLALKSPPPGDGEIVERWDDDDFDNLDDIQFRAASTATSIMSHPQSAHRDSSSRLSIRSDSNQGDENWDVLVDEQASMKDAIALAKSKGIPLPTNVPRSALEGGTIRRLKGKEIKKVIGDDWSEDLDFDGSNAPLKLTKHDDRHLSESLRQISAAFHSSPVSPDVKDIFNKTIKSPKSRTAPTPVSLDAFQEEDEDDEFAEVPTIRVAKQRSPQKPVLFSPPATTAKLEFEPIEEDLELPADGQLRLSTRKPAPRTPAPNDDFDLEWAEGSLGTRNARGGRSARSSSASALSPSVSSAFTAESEDEGLDGLVLPDGPIKFQEKLKTRQVQPAEPETASRDRQPPRSVPNKEEFLDDFDIGDGDVFDAAKLTLNRNVKHKTQRSASPPKRTTTTLNFTSTKSTSTISRLPRFQPSHERHERSRSNLEPVSETGAPIARFQRPGSRLGTHSTQIPVSSIPPPPSPGPPSTPSRRGLRSTDSKSDLRYEPPTTTNAQLLRAKRSMPAIRNLASPTKSNTFNRPPSRQDTGSRLILPPRPKTPTDRADSRLSDIRKGVPFLPAGASSGQSQHISIKTTSYRHSRHPDSESSNESMSAAQRSLSRLAGLGRPETPGRGRSGLTAAELAAQAKKTITKPTRRRNYGDGSELEIFDDLPTSATVESKFTKLPIAKGAPRSLRSKLGLGQFSQSTTSLVSSRTGTETPMPATPLTPRTDFSTAMTNTNVPRFARDTAASRNAREQRQISTTFQNIRGEPLQPLSTNWKTQPAVRPLNLLRKKASKTQQKPHLIKPMGNDMNRPKSEKGMQYNPLLFRWEGNENALAPFDVPDFHPRTASPGAAMQGSPTGKANVALISNVGSNISGVQVVGGMVFDPSQMRWLKVAENSDPALRGGVGSVQVEEEEDVFAGLEDLKEEDETRSRSSIQQLPSQSQPQHHHHRDNSGRDRAVSIDSSCQDGEAMGGHSSGDEWNVAEEFDVGPEFVRRQKMEEDRWRRKVEKWLRNDGDADDDGFDDGAGADAWKWAIRELVQQADVMT